MELELKFALNAHDLDRLPGQLARVPLIGQGHPLRQTLRNTYYDTPDHALHARGVALRVRQLGDAKHPQWLQTLKVGGAAASALSRRGEWEDALTSQQLSRALLDDTPWRTLDPDDRLFDRLQPLFTTTFERLAWTITLEKSVVEGVVEVALDRGQVQMDGKTTPLCELEIELREGAPEALFEVARQIGQQLCLLPLHLSKAERAYRLAEGTLHAPCHALPPELGQHLAWEAVARAVLRDGLLQFSANLVTLRESDAPEVLHQARVGWRRFKSALKLFQQPRGRHSVPALASLAALKPLLDPMTALRDLEVAANEVFPTLAAAFQEGNAQGAAHAAQQWQQLQSALATRMAQQRQALRRALAQVGVGSALLELTRWLELEPVAPVPALSPRDLQKPAACLCKRLQKLADGIQETQAAQQSPTTPQSTPSAPDGQAQHRLRILSKRLRYGVENLLPLLPAKRARRWLHLAKTLQTQIGLERDLRLAIEVARQLQAADSVVAFLRGVAFGQGVV